jgi:hypothetical protein
VVRRRRREFGHQFTALFRRGHRGKGSQSPLSLIGIDLGHQDFSAAKLLDRENQSVALTPMSFALMG